MSQTNSSNKAILVAEGKFVMSNTKLCAEALYHPCIPEQLPFDTTEDLEDPKRSIGQPRAVEAIDFGVGMEKDGYNVYASGLAGTGKYNLVRELLEKRSENEPVPPDVCYVNNFETPHKPPYLRLPPGKGKGFQEDMKALIEDARNALKSAFENEEYQNRRQTLTQEFQEQQQEAFEELQKRAKERSLTVVRTPAGIVFAPVKNDEMVPPEEFNKLSEEERKQAEKDVEELQAESRQIFQKVPIWEREMRDRVKDLNREVTGFAIGPLMGALRDKYADIDDVVSHLKAVEKDIIKNVRALLPEESDQKNPLQQMLRSVQPDGRQAEDAAMHRYQVNILIDNLDTRGAPVVFEDNPTYQNLVGRVEHQPHMGTLLTDFNMIRTGALHRANGGYLILDALKVLQQPFAWEALKRCLKSRKIKIESMGEMYGLISTVSLSPEPVSLNVKVVLTGPPLVYYILKSYDPEFSDLFKVTADFDTIMNRTPENQSDYCRLLANIIRQESLRPFDRGAVARVIEQGSRMVGDGERLSVHMRTMTDLLKESDYWAGRNGNGTVKHTDVQKAVDAWIFRSDRARQRMQEEIRRGTILIDTEGKAVGQVNGLSVIQLGEFSFGRPSRITARIRLGKGEVIDIEREVEMGGPIHSKGVLILTGFLGGRYAVDHPLSLSASLVFEQSYGGIEGDSASSAELYALLSTIAGIPVKQSVAVTGSVNQHGQVQAIGGVNQKIEGFFDICRENGLNGEQGVIIPASNRKHLMLRKNVIDAVSDGRFHIYAVENIDQGMEILTGVPSGEPDESGRYPEGSVNGKVFSRLAELSKKRLEFAKASETGTPKESI
jgi:lon-related putative ATP-dependent protease